MGIEPFIARGFSSLSQVLHRSRMNRSQARQQIRADILWLMPEGSSPPTDREVWERIDENSARWAEQRIVSAVIRDDLAKSLEKLAPFSRASNADRSAARDDICDMLIEELASAGTPDPLTRSWREFWRLNFNYKKRREGRLRRRGTDRSGHQLDNSADS